MIKGGKGHFFLKFTDNDFVPCDQIVVKSVQRLTRLMKDKVGYIYHIVNRAQADRLQPRLQPFRRVPNGYVVDDKGGITVAFFRGKNRSEAHTSELQSRGHIVCRLLLDIKST